MIYLTFNFSFYINQISMKKIILLFCSFLLLFSCNKENNSKNIDNTSNKNKTLIAIFSHPDDELIVSPILSKYAKEGVNVLLVIATNGANGVTKHANIPAGDSLTNVRNKEIFCATKILGINDPIMLNFEDGKLSSWNEIFSLDDKIDSLFNKYKPDVVITWGPEGGYGHSDHRIVSNIVTEVFQKNRPIPIKELFYVGFLQEAFDSVPKLSTHQGNWFRENYHTTQKKFLTYRIPYSKEDFKIAREALGCHKSQLTIEVMDDMFTLFGQTNGIQYLRPWNGSNTIKDDIFK